MLSKESLHTLLNINQAENAPLFKIYAPASSSRLNYVCEFIFKHVLRSKFQIYSDLKDFETTKGNRINYSSVKIDGCLQIVPNGLLKQKEISELKPVPVLKNNCLYFYENETNDSNSKDCFHFDVFSSVFYLISRYEEWQKFKPDNHARFEVNESILFKHHFHLKPLVEIWIKELKTELQKNNSSLVFPETKFRVISTIDIDNLYAFKSKGFIRTLGASIKDVFKGDLTNLSYRIRVLSDKLQDPFDIYESISDFCFEKKIPLIYFFLFKTGDRYNRTVDPASGAFQKVFQSLKLNHALFGLHPSYDAGYHKQILEQEVKDLSKQSGEEVVLSRQHYLRFDIRSTPNSLLEQGIFADFTMGYASQAGFRAGTSHPFYYFDFNSEKRSELLFVPFCVMDGAYTVYKNTGPEVAFNQMWDLANEIRKVNGIFISVFHERSFSDHLYPGFGTLYKKLHTKLQDH